MIGKLLTGAMALVATGLWVPVADAWISYSPEAGALATLLLGIPIVAVYWMAFDEWGRSPIGGDSERQ